MSVTDNIMKSYSDRTYKYTTMVRHKGTVVALAMDDQRRIYYSVLDLNNSEEGKSPLDVNYWLENPKPLNFCHEIVQVGYGIVDPTKMPIVKKGSRTEAEPETLRPEEIDPFLSTTARLTADASFVALSDGKYIYIFRQSIDNNHEDMVYARDLNGKAVVDKDGNTVPVVNETLLVDRFVLAGTQIQPKMEVRYKRSRNKYRGQSNKDSLGAQDMEKKPFLEPTHELDFVRNLRDGRFTVLLLPTQIAGIQRWQLFAHNSKTDCIESFNVERSADGLFNTKGTQLYTSPDPEYQKSVFERQPGTCPFTGQELVPIVTKSKYAESALEFTGQSYMSCGDINLANQSFTIEFWAKRGGLNTQQYIIAQGKAVKNNALAIGFRSNNNFFMEFWGNGIDTTSTFTDHNWHHWACSYDNTGERIRKLYCDGVVVQMNTSTSDSLASGKLFFGCLFDLGCRFSGTLDEVRIWNRTRSADEIKADMYYRLEGREPGLVGYWQFDEASGNTVSDRTDNANYGRISGTPQWVRSDAPIGDRPGIRSSSVQFAGRTIESGLSAMLYYQQENAATGYDQQQKPIKKNARVMLAVGTGDKQNSNGKNYIGVLDLAVSREGKVGQIPDNLSLPLLSNDGAEGLSSNEVLEQISSKEKSIQQLQGAIKQLEGSIQNISETLPGMDTEIGNLDQKIKTLEQKIIETKDLQYRVTTYTGDVSGAGTDANVYVTLIGSLQRSREFEIDNSSDNFERGDWDYFGPFGLGEIGSLQQVRIRHDNSGSGPGWYLGKVLVGIYHGSTLLEQMEFRCMRWLARDEDDGRIDRTLSPVSLSSLRDRVNIQREIDQTTNEQNDLKKQKNELSTLKDEQELSIVNTRNELSEQQKLLAALKAQLGVVVPKKMSILHIDPLGLTMSGGLLSFACTKDIPQLFDSATGQVSLYFRGMEDQFFAAYYDTQTKKSQSLLPATTGNLTFVARSAEPEIDESVITVSDGSSPKTCTVNIKNSAIALTETWNDVPRDVERFSDVINGTASEKVFIGSLWKDVFGIVTSLTVEKPVKHPLKPNDTLVLGDTKLQVSEAVERSSTDIAIASAMVETAINTSVYLLPYDYANKASTNQLTSSLENGSLQFSAFSGNAQGIVRNGSAMSSGATVSCQWVPQSPGKALAFDGQNDYVGLADPAASGSARTSALQLNGDDYIDCGGGINLSNRSFTVETWAKRSTISRDNEFIMCQGSAGENLGFHIGFRYTNRFTMAFYGNDLDTPGTYTDTEWHHWSCTYNSTTKKRIIYCDGQQVASDTSRANYQGTGDVHIGQLFNEMFRFNGDIAEFRIWDRDRTGQEIQSYMNQPLQGQETGLIAYWRFEASGAKDYSGNGHIGTYVGNPQLVDSSPLNLAATTALQFHGQEDKVDIPYKPEINPAQFTVELWAKLTGGSGYRSPLTSRDDFPQRGYMFYANPNNKWQINVGQGSGWRSLYASSNIALNTWTHLCLTLESSNLKFYVNGKLEAQTTVNYSLNTARPLRLGAGATERSGDYYFNGAIDEVRIWNRARTQTEIQAEMGRRLQGKESSLVGYWRFEAGLAKDYSSYGNDGNFLGNPELVGPATVKLPPPPVVDESETGDFRSQLAKSDASGDLTLETWVNPGAVINNTRVIHHHSPNSKYTLGLQPKDEGYNCFVGVGSQFKQSQETLRLGQWQHLALVYKQSYGVQFNGSAYLSCDHSPTLDITQGLTIEAFLQFDDLKQPQGILTKGQLDDGSDNSVPYSVYIDTDGKVAFAFEDKDGDDHVCKSNKSLTAGQFYKIAVTRSPQFETKDEGDSEMPNVKIYQWADIRFYINQEEAGYVRYVGKDAGNSDQPLEIGKTYKGSQENLFKGILGELRLYNTALKTENLGTKIQGKEKGLVSWWRFEENEGNIVYDAKSTNHGIIKGAKWVKNPDPKASVLLFYCNGSTVELKEIPDSGESREEFSWGEEQFTLGASKLGASNGGLKECFTGTMEEVRIWKVARTQEQIQDNLFSRLKGEKEDLIANYTFEFDNELGGESELQDHSLLGNHLILGSDDSRPAAVISTAPISNDIAQVRSALGGVKTQFHDVIHSAPTVQEYGDVQYNAGGNLIGVHKRCYGTIKDGQWYLLTGYKVGNLVTEWVGQVQANPQIIGYIEGAPPVPSENLTSTGLKLGEFEDYNGCSAVELEEADTVNYIYASSKESGFDTAIDLTVQGGAKSRTLAGVGITQEVSDVNLLAGAKTTLEYSSSSLNESNVSYGRNTTKTSRLELKGTWEQAETEINPAVGRRFIPANIGFALVQSDTMDVFALRLAHNDALVSYRMQPNPDIPKDWNIITFPLNNTYTKQGTLDGKVGMKEDGSVQCDLHYPNATTYGQYSYFKPIEAYSLKKQIDREQQELQTYYQSYSTSTSLDGSSDDVSRNMSSRNLVNTYVWTADGGFFSESTEVMESVQESTTSSYSFQGMNGVAVETNIAALGGVVHIEMDALFGGHVETVKTKGKESEKSFGVTVEVTGDNDLQLYANTDAEREKYKGRINEGGGVYDEEGNPVFRPGKVDAYRFMTFYLEPTKNNFEDFFNKVVDPMWLEQSDAPNAVALRQANQGDKKPKCWRIMHRVTYVSRILPEIAAENAPLMEKAMKSINVGSNYELIKKLEPFVKNKTQDYAIFSDAVRKTLKLYLPELQPHEQDIIQYAALYFGLEQE